MLELDVPLGQLELELTFRYLVIFDGDIVTGNIDPSSSVELPGQVSDHPGKTVVSSLH